MRVFILGANGMIGHQLWFRLNQRYPGQVWGTVRKSKKQLQQFDFFSFDRIFEFIDVTNFKTVAFALSQVKPDIIINCVGITLRKPEIKDAGVCLEVNAMFPHRLTFWAKENRSMTSSRRLVNWCGDTKSRSI